jgi:hypothetical protein
MKPAGSIKDSKKNASAALLSPPFSKESLVVSPTLSISSLTKRQRGHKMIVGSE